MKRAQRIEDTSKSGTGSGKAGASGRAGAKSGPQASFDASAPLVAKMNPVAQKLADRNKSETFEALGQLSLECDKLRGLAHEAQVAMASVTIPDEKIRAQHESVMNSLKELAAKDQTTCGESAAVSQPACVEGCVRQWRWFAADYNWLLSGSLKPAGVDIGTTEAVAGKE